MRTKIDYGIHITPTFACMARMENGEPVVVKSNFQKDTLPMCVGFNKKGNVLVGDIAWNSFRVDQLRSLSEWDSQNSNAFTEFTRTLGTDKTYHSSHMVREFTSEELLAEVLKKMKAFVADEEISAVVLTCPAKFGILQKDALVRAGKLAGFKQIELIKEPIAASMAYGLTKNTGDGYWVVFDFNEGCFNVSIIKVDNGIQTVIDNDGENYLGDKNLVMAISDKIMLPYLKDEYLIDSILEDDAKKQRFQEVLKYYAKEALDKSIENKEYWLFSDLGDIPGEDDNGEEFELDITIDQDKLKMAIAPIFQRAIEITKDLIQRNNLSGDKVDALILVGGPTYSPILREMLEKQIIKPDTSADPITAIATGAALYASTLDSSDEIKEASRDKTKIQLDIGYEPSTVETEEWVTLKILPEKTEGDIPEKVFAEIERGDKAWSSGKVAISERGEIIEVKLNEGKPNSFDVILFDEAGNKLKGIPDHFIIRQSVVGGGGAAGILNYSIGIAADIGKPYKVFLPIEGLEKNVSLPATGTINGLETKTDIRPGNSNDKFRVRLYQGEHDSSGSRAIYNKPIYDVTITGDDLPLLLPEGSYIDLTVATDRSSGRIVKLEAYFPYLNYLHEVPIPVNPPSSITQRRLSQDLDSAEATIQRLKSNSLIDQIALSEIEKDLAYQRERIDKGGGEVDRRLEIFGELMRLLRKIDTISENVDDVYPYQLKEKLIELYSEHPEIPQDKFKALFDELYTFSGNGSLTDENIQRLRAIDKEIDELI